MSDTYEIWQLKSGPATARLLFLSSDYLDRKGLAVDFANYEQVYRDRLRTSDTLDGIYQRFNIHRPEDLRGHSLSVSDLIVVRQPRGTQVFFVDSFGFKDVTDKALSAEVILSPREKPSVRKRLQEAAKQKGQESGRTQERKRTEMEL